MKEVGIPHMVEGRPYPLGGCSNVGNKKLKEDFRRYSVEQPMLTTLTKWLEMETLLLFYKKIKKQLSAGSPLGQSTNGRKGEC